MLLLSIPTAHADTLAIFLQDPVNAVTVTIFDQEAGDANPAVGAVTFIGAVGAWNLNVTTGLGFPVLGSPTNLNVDLNSVDLTSSGGTLLIGFSQTNYIDLPRPLRYNLPQTSAARPMEPSQCRVGLMISTSCSFSNQTSPALRSLLLGIRPRGIFREYGRNCSDRPISTFVLNKPAANHQPKRDRASQASTHR
jgi:hypothetical protein